MTDSEPEFHLLGTGTWRDLLPRLPRPVFALGRDAIFRVLVHGDGFVLPIPGGRPAVGFYTTRFVAARTTFDAEKAALSLVEADWQEKRHKQAAGPVTLAVNEVEVLSARFRLRSGAGYTFYTADDDIDANSS